MNGGDSKRTAALLRRAFDESFAVAALTNRTRREALLFLRVYESELAVRASEVAAVSRCPPLTRLPSQNPSVLGLARLRGRLCVVHSFADLVGEPRGKPNAGALLLLCAAEPSVGLLADELLGHVQADADTIYADPTQGGWSNAIVSGGGKRCPLASIPLLLAAIRQATSTERRSDET